MRDQVTVWLSQVKKACLSGGKLFLATGRLVDEAIQGEYHKDLGFDNLEDYIDNAYAMGDFPCQKREAWDRLKVVRGAAALKVKDSMLLSVAPVKLKDIFSLDPARHSEEMLELLKGAQTLHMAEVRLRVKAIKSGKSLAQVAAESATPAETVEPESGETVSKDGVKLSFKLNAANAAVVRKALALFDKEPSEAIVKMAAAAIAAATVPEKAMEAGA